MMLWYKYIIALINSMCLTKATGLSKILSKVRIYEENDISLYIHFALENMKHTFAYNSYTKVAADTGIQLER